MLVVDETERGIRETIRERHHIGYGILETIHEKLENWEHEKEDVIRETRDGIRTTEKDCGIRSNERRHTQHGKQHHERRDRWIRETKT